MPQSYRFGPLELKKEVYIARGHITEASDEEVIRAGFAALLRGEKALPMEVRGWSQQDPATLAAQQQMQQVLMMDWLSGKSSPKVRVNLAPELPGTVINRK